MGPYISKEFCLAVLNAYIDLCMGLDWDGGRRNRDTAMTDMH